MKNFNIPIFVPHRGCPYDCVFCNQNRITGTDNIVTAADVRNTIEEYLKTLPYENRHIEAAFFGGSFTGIPIEEQTELLSAAYKYVESGQIDGIRLSTRPDYIDTEILDNLLKYGVTTIELGVQSMDEDVLKASNRGHTAEDVERACTLIRKYPFRLGLQMMTGLPADTREKSVETAGKIIALKPEMVRIYPTLTIRGTRLAQMYESGEYTPQTLDSAAEECAEILCMFEKAGIDVIRIGLQPTDEICENGGSVIAGPVHSAFGEMVESAIYRGIILDKLKECTSFAADIYVSPKEVSKAVGNKKTNITKIKEATGIQIKVHGDENLQKREVRCNCC